MTIRVYLTGRVGVQVDGNPAIREEQFRGRQERLAFAYLVSRREQPVQRDDLAAVLWPSEADLPPAWQTALSALLSRLRHLLSCDALRPYNTGISRGFGQYQLRLPADTFVDVDYAAHAVDIAEGALKLGDPRGAFGQAWAAVVITRRPFLSGETGPWVEAQRGRQHRQLIRALECMARSWLATGEPLLAVEAASEAVSLDGLREASYHLLMRAYDASGNRPEAIKTYHRLRERLVDELGSDPSRETEALFLELLG